MRYLSFFLALVLVGCTGQPDDDWTDTERPESTQAHVVDSIGVYEGDEPYMFGRIGGVTRDDEGRIFVADGQHHEVRVFDDDGVFEFAIGEEGEGPGELHAPCCPAFEPEGFLWVRDSRNQRYNQYEINGSAVYRDALSMAHNSGGLWTTTTFDANGHLVDVGSTFDEEAGQPVRTRFYTDSDGETSRELAIPNPPTEKSGQASVSLESGIAYIYQPFGPRHLIAHGPEGHFATAAGMDYTVVWRQADGDTLHVIERNEEGPELSGDEIERGESQLDRSLERWDAQRSDVPFGVPNQKPALTGLHFDQNGRLWVERSIPDGAPRLADIYDADGALVEVVQWPRDIDLRYGWIGDDVIFGIGESTEGAPQVKVLEY